MRDLWGHHPCDHIPTSTENSLSRPSSQLRTLSVWGQHGQFSNPSAVFKLQLSMGKLVQPIGQPGPMAKALIGQTGAMTC